MLDDEPMSTVGFQDLAAPADPDAHPASDPAIFRVCFVCTDGSQHRARQFEPDWFAELDLVIAFDRGQERTLREWATSEPDRAKVQLLMTFEPDGSGTMDVPDPYYSDAALFEIVLVTIERASVALFRQLEPGIRQGVS